MPVSFESRVCTPPHVVSRRLDDELVLLNLDSESYFGLDDVGTRMWEALSSSDSVEAGFQQLLAEYDVDETTLRADVERLLEQLVDAGLVELGGR